MGRSARVSEREGRGSEDEKVEEAEALRHDADLFEDGGYEYGEDENGRRVEVASCARTRVCAPAIESCGSKAT